MLESYYSLPSDEYMRTDEVCELRNEPDIIKRLEPYCIKEITRMICLSPELLEYPEYKDYKDIYLFYSLAEDEIVPETEKFLNEVEGSKVQRYLPIFDRRILEAFLKTESILRKKINEKKNILRELDEKRRDYEKRIRREHVKEEEILRSFTENNESISRMENGNNEKDEIEVINQKRKGKELWDEITECRQCIERMKKELVEINKRIKFETKQTEYLIFTKEKREPTYKSIRNCLEKFEKDQATSRSEVYALQRGLMGAEVFLVRFVEEGSVANEDREKLQSTEFLEELICFLQESYKRCQAEIIYKLAEKELIDLKQKSIVSCLQNVPGQLCFLISQQIDKKHPRLISEMEKTVELLSVILDDVIQKKNDAILDERYLILWNRFTRQEDWQWWFGEIKSEVPNRYIDVLVAFMLHPGIECRKSMLNAFDYLYERGFFGNERIFDICEAIVRSDIENVDNEKQELMLHFVRKLEIEKQTSERNARSAQRAYKKQTEELFGAICEPVEKMELLTTNLISTDTDDEISKVLIGSQFAELIVELREGLSVVGVNTLDDSDAWLTQTPVRYNSKKHNISKPKATRNVLLRTMGFSYENEDRKIEKRLARAEIICRTQKETT